MGKRHNAPSGEAISKLEEAAQQAIEAAGGDAVVALLKALARDAELEHEPLFRVRLCRTAFPAAGPGRRRYEFRRGKDASRKHQPVTDFTVSMAACHAAMRRRPGMLLVHCNSRHVMEKLLTPGKVKIPPQTIIDGSVHAGLHVSSGTFANGTRCGPGAQNARIMPAG